MYTRILQLALAVAVFPIYVTASPMYITFEGLVDVSLGATPEYVGQRMSATFMYDTEVDGYFYLEDGTKLIGKDTIGMDYFYAAAVSTKLDDVPFVTYGLFGGASDSYYAGTGNPYATCCPERTIFHVFDSFTVHADRLLSGLVVGYVTPDNFWAQFRSDTENVQVRGFELTYHGPTNPVPLPAAVGLFGGALGALGLLRRRRPPRSRPPLQPDKCA